MWHEHLEAYGVEGARVVPYSMADKILPDLKLFKLVICDESHNLRNDTTKAHEAIRDYVRRNSSKVLLLTATPYNLAFADVANQLALYIDEDDDLGIVPSAAMAKDPNLADKVDGKTNTSKRSRGRRKPTTGAASCPTTSCAEPAASSRSPRGRRPSPSPTGRLRCASTCSSPTGPSSSSPRGSRTH
jgi:hypothetical protein